jgi:beta-glucanase (GH16 family)
MRRRSIAALALLAAAGCKPPAAGDGKYEDPHGPVSWTPGAWSLVWGDEFDGEAGAAPDATKWAHELGDWGWGNEELQNYTDSLTNTALDGDGHLVITARAEASGKSAYSSGRLRTKGLFERAYGRFEARMKLTSGRGLWPAFWIMGNDIDAVGWPSAGEMDIVEERGSEPANAYGSVHGPTAPTRDLPVTGLCHPPGGVDADFHVYAVEWDPENIVFLCDDHAYLQITPARRPSNAKWVWDHPFYLIVNLAVGGLFGGPPDATTPFPATIEIDYVRVSARAADGGAIDGGTATEADAGGDEVGADGSGEDHAASD